MALGLTSNRERLSQYRQCDDHTFLLIKVNENRTRPLSWARRLEWTFSRPRLPSTAIAACSFSGGGTSRSRNLSISMIAPSSFPLSTSAIIGCAKSVGLQNINPLSNNTLHVTILLGTKAEREGQAKDAERTPVLRVKVDEQQLVAAVNLQPDSCRHIVYPHNQMVAGSQEEGSTTVLDCLPRAQARLHRCQGLLHECTGLPLALPSLCSTLGSPSPMIGVYQSPLMEDLRRVGPCLAGRKAATGVIVDAACSTCSALGCSVGRKGVSD